MNRVGIRVGPRFESRKCVQSGLHSRGLGTSVRSGLREYRAVFTALAQVAVSFLVRDVVEELGRLVLMSCGTDHAQPPSPLGSAGATSHGPSKVRRVDRRGAGNRHTAPQALSAAWDFRASCRHTHRTSQPVVRGGSPMTTSRLDEAGQNVARRTAGSPTDHCLTFEVPVNEGRRGCR